MNLACPSKEDSQRYKFTACRHKNPAWLWNINRQANQIPKDNSVTAYQHLCP